VNVGADLGAGPGGQHEREPGQRAQRGGLSGGEHRSRRGAVQRTAFALPGHLRRPGHRGRLHLRQVSELPSPPE
jgi:hypothetical protein